MTDAAAPMAELAALLIGSDRRRRERASRARCLLGLCDWAELGDYLDRLRVLPYAVAALADLDPSWVPPSLQERSQLITQTLGTRNGALESITAAICDELERCGVPVMQLKGTRLARRLHGDHNGRMSNDIDLLVRPTQLPTAERVCEGFGFRVEHPLDGGKLPNLHSRLLHAGGQLPTIELHWRVHWYETRFAEAMLSRSQIEAGVRQPTAEDELAALLLYYARDGFAGLRYPCDVSAWTRSLGRAARPEQFDLLGQSHPELVTSWQSALAMCEAIADVPHIAWQLPGRRRAGLAVRFASWDLLDSRDQIATNIFVTDALCMPAGGFRGWLRRSLLPPIDSITPLAQTPVARLPRLSKRCAHALKVAIRLAYAFGLVATRGRVSPAPPNPA